MPNRRIKILTPTGYDFFEVTPGGLVVTAANSAILAETRGRGTLFIQETNPNMTSAGMWVELNPDLTPKTVWIEDGF